MSPAKPFDVIDMIQQSAAMADRTAISFLRNAKSGTVDETLTYQDLDAAAQGIAARLTADGGSGQRVLLLFPDGLDFVTAFVGCLYAGAVAVPAPLPEQYANATDRAAAILRDAGARTVLTDGSHLELVENWLSAHGAVDTALHDVAVLTGAVRDWRKPTIRPENLAFLQYTSGSTSEPRGVMVSHGNLLANLETIHRTIGSTSELQTVGWLPAIHDMGLVGQLLSVIYVGGHLTLMSPNEFLRSPYRWLSLVGEFRATHTVAPNFAYDLCLRRITDQQITTLDLSSLQVVLNGAEPVRASTLSAFAERFGPAGFNVAAFSTCYGLAEATLLVTASPRLERPVTVVVDGDALAKGVLSEAVSDQKTQSLVSSGRPQDCSVLIVDRETGIPLPDSLVGEIWVRGDSVACGYWHRDDHTRELFGQTAAVAGKEEGWLRTGDLGAMWKGELFVTGRLRDMIIVGGRNLYPHDMEKIVGDCDEQLRSGSGAVFALLDGSEDFVVIQEARPALFRTGASAEVARKIRRVLAREFNVAPRTVLLVRPGAVKKTTSGKIRRSFMRELFLGGAVEGELYEKEISTGDPTE